MVQMRDSLTEKDDQIQQLQVEVEVSKMKSGELIEESGQSFITKMRAKDREIDQLKVWAPGWLAADWEAESNKLDYF